MQLYGSIPFAVVLCAATLWSVSVAWDSDRRDTRAMSAIFSCAGAWALLDLISQLEHEPARAIFWLELMHLPPLLLGPLTLDLLGQMRPRLQPELRPWIRLGFAWAIMLGLAAIGLPDVILSVTRAPWGGWTPRPGPISSLLVVLGSVLPLFAAIRAGREARCCRGSAAHTRVRALVVVVALALGTWLSTDLLLPAAGVETPRLGALALVITAGAMWLRVLHDRNELVHSPHGMARAVLAELHDGVALVQLDGVILSANARLGELVGRRISRLRGVRLDQLARIAISEVCRGVEDVESVLLDEQGGSIPVAVSSSLAFDGQVGPIGAVVVFRDLREVDVLRRRILTSGRLAAIGELAAGLAHEVNNPVAFIRADLHLLAARLEEIEEKLAKCQEFATPPAFFEHGPRRVARALAGIERVAEVVGDVRSFAHVGSVGDGGSDPVSLLEGTLRLARLERRGEVTIRVRCEKAMDRVAAGQELKQILLTLLRLLVTSSARGSVIEVELCGHAEGLEVVMRADRLAEPASDLVERIEQTRASSHGSRRDDLALAVAFELIDQLDGRLESFMEGDEAIRLQLRLRGDQRDAT